VFLKSVELFGFKSFADRSFIEFREGISALLGPNGCGKSNVVDAVKWVLGEQSTRSLRADRMEDIIFNGTESRKALNVAEVTLTLANDQGYLPIDMPEIAVKRRLHRSGESEYFINNTPVKLKEVRELFFDTGIGKSAYSIMEQGKIDQILSNRPEERRFIFEEAAGITKYKHRGAEADRKLAKTEENMQQVENILREVKRSYTTLKSQSEKTALYRQLNDSIFELELDLQLLKLKDLLNKQGEKEQLLEKKRQDRDVLRKTIDEINDSLEKNLDHVNDMEAKLIDAQKKLYGLDLETNNLENQKVLLKERIEEIQRQIREGEQREVAVKTRIDDITGQIDERGKQIDEYKQRLTEVDRNIDSFEKSMETAKRRIGENNNEIRRLEKSNESIETDIQRAQHELHQITDDIVAQLDQKLSESGYSSSRRKELEGSVRKALQEIRIFISGKRNLIDDMKKTAGDKDEHSAAVEKVLLSFGDMDVRINELEDLFSRYHDSIPSFIDEFLAPEGIITRKRTIEQSIEEGRKTQRENNEKLEAARKDNTQLTDKIDEYRKTLEELRVNRVQMHTQMKALADVQRELERQIGEQKGILEENRTGIETNRIRITEIRKKIEELDSKKDDVSGRKQILQKELKDLEKNISLHNKDLTEKESSLKKKMEGLAEMQDRLEKLQMEVVSLQTEIRTMYANFFDRHGRELTEFESRMFDIKSDGPDVRQKLQGEKQKLKNLGQVNLMAPEEFVEVKERYDFLNSQLEDLYTAREDLHRITREIKTESTELFLETYEQIKKNFHSLFRRLFGGGRGELKLTDPNNVLESGIEIFAQPPGKSLENIALLSGGERSLTAVALLFATYMVKPSPFCILDEIDAALDEANVGRFINLLMEFGKKSQFVVITHNKKTVAGTSTLLGVTMQESGVSKIIAVRLANNGELVAGEKEMEEVADGHSVGERT